MADPYEPGFERNRNYAGREMPVDFPILTLFLRTATIIGSR